jgi:hypothetical protein
LIDGSLETPRLSRNSTAGAFEFLGGALQASVVDFDLVNRGGRLAPGADSGTLLMLGNLELEAGTLALALGPSDHEPVHVRGHLRLGGTLEVEFEPGLQPAPGQAWALATAGAGISGRFSRIPENFRVDVIQNRLVLSYAEAPLCKLAKAPAHACCL